jgi:hypothetical protein
MIRTLVICVALAALCLISSQPVNAETGTVTLYDTVDAIKVSDSRITVTGIITGDSAPSTAVYTILSTSATNGGAIDVAASRCDRLALLAISKPGKFQFGMVLEGNSGARFSCKLIVRTP